MNNKNVIWEASKGDGPIIATAIHNGNELRSEVAEIISLSEESRLTEEDPFTEVWTSAGNSQVVGLRSRFEVDLNRPRDKAVYIKPEDAWGLEVWKTEPSQKLVANSLSEYDAFYAEMHKIFTELETQFGRFVVFDLHSYNHRRKGPDAPFDDPELNPEVNIGTGTMDRDLWAPLVERFISDLRSFNFNGRNLDVRENIKFKGGQFSRWIHQNFPESGCSLSIEFKKFFMDEWIGKPDTKQIDLIKQAIESTVPGVLEELKKMG